MHEETTGTFPDHFQITVHLLLPRKSPGRRSLVGCSPWDREESDTTERLHFHFSLSCIGEGNGTPLQCSCLENPRDGGAWWAAIPGVAQSLTRLKRLSSSSNRVGRGGERSGLNLKWKTVSCLHHDLNRRLASYSPRARSGPPPVSAGPVC